MNIAFIVTHFPALSETFVLNQITGLLRQGHAVDIYADRPGGGHDVHADVGRFDLLKKTCYAPRLPRQPLARAAQAFGLFARHFWSAPRQVASALNVFRYGRQAASFKLLHSAVAFLPRRPAYDVIHAHFGPNGIKALALRDIGAMRGRLVTTFHGYDVNVRARRDGPNIYRELFERGEMFTANTGFTARRLRELGCRSEKIVMLPMGVNVGVFQPAPRKAEPRNEVRLLTVARLVEPKGIEYAIQAVAILARRVPLIRYHVIGDGPLRAKLESLARELGVAKLVEFLGARTQEQVIESYGQADLFVLPSVVGRDGTQETQGLVLLEAQAMGLPVVASRIGGISESVREGETGFLVPERDPAALAERICYLLDHRQQWEQFGGAGRAFVKEHYDLARLNDRLIQLYTELVRG